MCLVAFLGDVNANSASSSNVNDGDTTVSSFAPRFKVIFEVSVKPDIHDLITTVLGSQDFVDDSQKFATSMGNGIGIVESWYKKTSYINEY